MRNATPIIVDIMGPNNFSSLYLGYSLLRVWGYRSQGDRDASLAIWFLTQATESAHDCHVSIHFHVVSCHFRRQACGGDHVHCKLKLV